MTGFYLYQTLHLLRGRVRLLDRHAALLDRCARELFGTGYAPDLRDLERRVLDTAAARRYPTDLSAFVRLELAADGTERLVPAGVSYYEGYALRSVRPDGVTVVCDPSDYGRIIAEIERSGNTEPHTRLELSAKAYTHTAEYDACIAAYMREKAGLNEKLFMNFDLVQTLRYGENPHQSAKFYRQAEPMPYSLAFGRQLNGKELSYNNIQDANAALNIVREFDEPFCVGLKHMNPCGAAIGKDVFEAWTKAYEADKVSIFGGIVAVNREIDARTAEAMKPIFLEIIIA
ncbi:MAG: hypothetical protein NC250_02515, partial [Alistipes senegalensis]|nr:hypothetical protein [Alistipes senegalensis]